jgi:hypothetical protein
MFVGAEVSPTKQTQYQCVVLRVDGAGKQLWQATVALCPYQLVPLPDGRGISITYSSQQGSDKLGIVQVVSADGSKVSNATPSQPSNEAWSTVALTGNNSYVVSGMYFADGASKGLTATMYLESGKYLWNTKEANGMNPVKSSVGTSDGGVAVVGGKAAVTDTDAFVVTFDAAGKTKWAKSNGGAGDEISGSVTTLPDGGLLVAHANYSKTATGLLRLDASGTLLWSKAPSGPDSSVLGVSNLAGGFVATGWVKVGETKSAGGLARFDLLGNQVWERKWPASAPNFLVGAAPIADGYLLAGSIPTNVNDVWLARADAWGNTACSVSGPCAGRAEFACDDQNPCSIDTCSAASQGCFHAKAADGTPCGGAKTCLSGACK